MKKYITLSLYCCLLVGSGILYAQDKQRKFLFDQIKHSITLGYNIGATAPFSFPNTIRQINSYAPIFSPSFGYQATYDLSSKWFVGTGLSVDVKGMKVTDSVQYFHTIISVDNGNGEKGSFEGDFTGTNATTSRNVYLTLPVFAGYRQGEWDFKLGMYFACLLSAEFKGTVSDGYIRKGNSLGEKVLIESADFDFSREVRSFDIGAHLGVSRHFGQRWVADLTGQLGLNPVFPSSFRGVGYNLHNMYLTLGVAYKLW